MDWLSPYNSESAPFARQRNDPSAKVASDNEEDRLVSVNELPMDYPTASSDGSTVHMGFNATSPQDRVGSTVSPGQQSVQSVSQTSSYLGGSGSASTSPTAMRDYMPEPNHWANMPGVGNPPDAPVPPTTAQGHSPASQQSMALQLQLNQHPAHTSGTGITARSTGWKSSMDADLENLGIDTGTRPVNVPATEGGLYSLESCRQRLKAGPPDIVATSPSDCQASPASVQTPQVETIPMPVSTTSRQPGQEVPPRILTIQEAAILYPDKCPPSFFRQPPTLPVKQGPTDPTASFVIAREPCLTPLGLVDGESTIVLQLFLRIQS